MQCVSMDVLSKTCGGAAVKPLSLFRARPEDVPGPHAGGPKDTNIRLPV